MHHRQLLILFAALAFAMSALAVAAHAAPPKVGMPPWPVPGQAFQPNEQTINGLTYYCQEFLYKQRKTGLPAYVQRCAPLPTQPHKAAVAKPKPKGYSA